MWRMALAEDNSVHDTPSELSGRPSPSTPAPTPRSPSASPAADDREAIAALAQLDSRRAPRGAVLLAEVDGELLGRALDRRRPRRRRPVPADRRARVPAARARPPDAPRRGAARRAGSRVSAAGRLRPRRLELTCATAPAASRASRPRGGRAGRTRAGTARTCSRPRRLGQLPGPGLAHPERAAAPVPEPVEPPGGEVVRVLAAVVELDLQPSRDRPAGARRRSAHSSAVTSIRAGAAAAGGAAPAARRRAPSRTCRLT